MDSSDKRVQCRPSEEPCDLCRAIQDREAQVLPSDQPFVAAKRAIDRAVENEARIQQESYEIA
jgi:hypothetical protein